MDETELREWVKDSTNSGPLVNEFFAKHDLDNPRPETDNPSDEAPRAIFTAGIPGAGKTELVGELKRKRPASGFVLIDPDQISKCLPDYSPQRHAVYRPATGILVRLILKRCLKEKRSLIMDSTLAYNIGRQNVSSIVRKGWHTSVYYVVLDPSVAYEATQKRETVVRRKIDMEIFVSVCRMINGNLAKIFDEHHKKSSFRFVYFDKGNDIRLARSKLNSWYSDQAGDGKIIGEKLGQAVDVVGLSNQL